MPPDDLVLAFDTSAAHVAAALLSGGAVLAEHHEEMARGQAERLFVLLKEMLDGAQVGWRDLSRIGVGIGPGNFTGIRISVAGARGLALSLGIPAIGVSTFEALSHSLRRPLVATVDARGAQLYVQAFTKTGICEPYVSDIDTIAADFSSNNQGFVGHQAQELAQLAGARALAPKFPLAVAIAHIAAASDAARAPRPAPLYLRPPN
ncbi:MAG: tRNA (adenosine(37)-N6)-threonylcarbamoyltransferase complex dimerization subunit type 1 TsaB, partial [Paracoccaceae bacterium]